MAKKYNRIFNFQINDALYSKIQELATKLGVSPSAAVRLLIEHADIDFSVVRVGDVNGS